MLITINLHNFRNYYHTSTSISQFNLLIGENGSGKTNFLEAISLLSPGKGLRGANLNDLINYNPVVNQQKTNDTSPSSATQDDFNHLPTTQAIHNQGQFIVNCVINHDLSGKKGKNQIKVKSLIDPATNNLKKIFLLDDEPLSKQSDLHYYCKPIWITPKMDTFFLEDNTNQRKFFDRLIYNFHPSHLGRLNAYNQAITERNRLLKSQNYNNTWLNAIEEVISERGIAIAATRLEFIEKLNQALAYYGKVFSNIKVELNGFIEKLLVDNSALATEHKFKQELYHQRQVDAQSGSTSTGLHKSQFNVINLNNGLNAKLCSTGQQKIMLITIIMTITYLMTLEYEIKPILLFDEVLTHLDSKVKNNLLEQLLNIGSQCLITATEVDTIKGFENNFNILEVKDQNLLKY